MRYLPHTSAEIDEMLRTIGVESLEDLFASIPAALRLDRPLDLPRASAEPDLLQHLQTLAEANAQNGSWKSFLGAGSYAHFIPAIVGYLVERGEFLSPYTPYQPEISQGTLQAIFEYQSMMAELFGVEVANASNYDLSTAIVEAVLMAQRVTRRQDYCVATNVNPMNRDVLSSTLQASAHGKAALVPTTADGLVDQIALQQILTDRCAACVVQYPSFFGTVEDLRPIAKMVHAAGALLIVAVPDPIAMGLLEAPGTMGADIVVAEGQPLGNPVNYGGPYVGIFATRTKHVRQMPGRLSGMTVDSAGERSFVLTLSTREQFIRRERATSNICTNQQLCALATTIYTAWLGKVGLQKLARTNWEKAEYAKQQLSQVPGVTMPFDAPTFHEFVIQLPRPAAAVLEVLRAREIFGGVALEPWYPEWKHSLLVCVTEQNRRDDIDAYATALREVLA